MENYKASSFESLEGYTLYDLFEKSNKNFKLSDAYAYKVNDIWVKYSSDEVLSIANNLALGMLEKGIQKKDKVGIISPNRPEWNFVDIACLKAGFIDTPLYPTISNNDMSFILKDADVKIMFVANDELHDKVLQVLKLSDIQIPIFVFDENTKYSNYKTIIELGKSSKKSEELKALNASIKPDDLATLIYTSGTTGNPKGVMLSHRNLTSNVEATYNLAPWIAIKKALSFLPLNHVYERMLAYTYVNYGVSIYYAESLEKIGDNLKEVQPQMFVTVPRLLEKVYDKIITKGEQLTGIKKKLFFWALELGHNHELNKANGWWYEFKLKIANKLIFSKWREALGNKVIVIATGGAALQERLARVFTSAGISVLQGYGLTETSPVLSVNNFYGGNKYGSVGPILENVKIKIAEDGEILAKGPNIMLGYYKRPDLTAEVMDSEGWFHTGDIGVIVDNRFLKITDRKKEIFKTSGEKYIAPQMIENKFKESRFIEQAMVIGENEKYPAAFVVPSFTFLQDYCKLKGYPVESNENVINNPVIIDRIKEVIKKINEELSQHERIKKFELIPHEWTIERGELTPKLSLRRKIILANNRDKYDKIYNEN